MSRLKASYQDLQVQDLDEYVLLDDQESQTVRLYQKPEAIITAFRPDELKQAFDALERHHRAGAYLAGYCAYEMGYAFEARLKHHLKDNKTPLLKFGVFSKPQSDISAHMRYTRAPVELDVNPLWSEKQYLQRFEKVMAYIRAGDVYQINLTFPLAGTYKGTAHTLYAALRQRQASRYGGIVNLGGAQIMSFSPELFFEKHAAHMSMRPMKGTRPRGRTAKADREIALEMRMDAKSQAENLMIVDLLRNDLSRLSRPGSVSVPSLFSIETFPTLHQMTSQITSELKSGVILEEIFRALFPCGSVTGAPKIRAMEIIEDLEETPRGAYCGAMGYIDPDGSACFNVGIRTLSLEDGTCHYGIGSGVVLDSDGADEYRECLLKADILHPLPPRLIETFKWEVQNGFIHLDAHIARLKKSARKLSYTFNQRKIRRRLERAVQDIKTDQHVRLSLSKSGDINITLKDFISFKSEIKVIISAQPLSEIYQHSADKISARDFYAGELARLKKHYEVDEVIFTNPDGDLCEGAFTNLFLENNGQIYTPHIKAGLLPGILRAKLIKTGKAVEKPLTLDDLYSADRLFMGNSMRGLMPANLIRKTPA